MDPTIDRQVEDLTEWTKNVKDPLEATEDTTEEAVQTPGNQQAPVADQQESETPAVNRSVDVSGKVPAGLAASPANAAR
ncbi:MAG: hypothetical protein GY917_25305 [Planctomycetaceae bacterium]|nr:hypothetical protein [Planctomycetaceae bacterium]